MNEPAVTPVSAADHVKKVLAIVAFFLVWLAIYKFLNNWGTAPELTHRFTRPVDRWPWIIQPWTAFIYIFAGYIFPVLPFFYQWNWRGVRLTLLAYGIASSIAFICYWLYPMSITRPPYEGDTIGEWLMRKVVTVDNEANCCPSSHTFFAILPALLVSRFEAGKISQSIIWFFAIAICITTVTTGQHYVIDVPGRCLGCNHRVLRSGLVLRAKEEAGTGTSRITHTRWRVEYARLRGSFVVSPQSSSGMGSRRGGCSILGYRFSC